MFTWSVCGVSFDLWRWAPSPIYHGLPSNCHCLMSGLNPGILPANWKDFTKFLGKMMDKNIPSKTTSIRHNLPWLNSSLKRMIRKKQRLYNKAKCTNQLFILFYFIFYFILFYFYFYFYFYSILV